MADDRALLGSLVDAQAGVVGRQALGLGLTRHAIEARRRLKEDLYR
ncbi:MAG: hypothetical protein JWR24_867 [Actinoallomurus sp.]|jgi:hypothetical protein|nr:hypothetical protein [Actinoallomurus sp.]